MLKKIIKKEKSLKAMSLDEIYKKYPHTIPMNKKSSLEYYKEDKNKIWINPNHQEIFNSGWFTIEDIRDHALWKGKIMKGSSQEDYDKIKYYYEIYKKTYYSLYHNYDNLWMLDIKHLEGPIDVLNMVSNKYLKEVLSHVAFMTQNDLKYIPFENHLNEIIKVKKLINNYCYGIYMGLKPLGLGEWEYCNTPETLENLAWSKGLVFDKIYHEYLLDNNVKLPDFEFIRNLK